MQRDLGRFLEPVGRRVAESTGNPTENTGKDWRMTDFCLFLGSVKEDMNRHIFSLAMRYPRSFFTYLVGEPMSLFGLLRRT